MTLTRDHTECNTEPTTLVGCAILRSDMQLRGAVTVDALISNVCCSGDLENVAELFKVRTDRTSSMSRRPPPKGAQHESR